MVLITTDIQDKLIKKFGTFKPGDCIHCNQRDTKPTYSRYSDLKCGAKQCLLLSTIKMIEAKESVSLSDNKDAKTMLGKVSKLNMLGYRELLDPPWVIMKSNNDLAWVNPVRKVGSSRTYKDYFVAKNLLVCYTQLKPSYCEVFSIHSGDINIVQDLPGIKHSMKNPLTSSFNQAYREAESRSGVVYLYFTDPSSNQKLGVLVSEFGDRLAFPYQEKVLLSRSGSSDIEVQFLKMNQILRLDNRLNIIRAPKSIPFIKI